MPKGYRAPPQTPPRARRQQPITSARRADEQLMWTLLAYLGRVSSHLDVVCGDGWRVRATRKACDSKSVGLTSDRTVLPEGRLWAPIVLRDFDRPFVLDDRFELVTDFSMYPHTEVAIAHSTKWVVIAPINADSMDWSFGFVGSGFGLQPALTAALRQALVPIWDSSSRAWLPRALQVYKHA